MCQSQMSRDPLRLSFKDAEGAIGVATLSLSGNHAGSASRPGLPSLDATKGHDDEMHYDSRRSLLLGLLLLSGASALTLEEAKQNGIRLGFPNEPPNTFVAGDGKVTGAYNDLVIAVLNKIGVTKVEGVVMDFASLIPALQANRIDVIPAIFIRPQRCEVVAFSTPVERSGTAFLVAKGNPKNVHSYDDVAKGDAKVGVMAGAVEQGYATRPASPTTGSSRCRTRRR